MPFHDDPTLSLAARHTNAIEHVRTELMNRGILGSTATALVNSVRAQVAVLAGGPVRLASPAGQLLSATGEDALRLLTDALAAQARAANVAAGQDTRAVTNARQSAARGF